MEMDFRARLLGRAAGDVGGRLLVEGERKAVEGVAMYRDCEGDCRAA
jgi:hypothetical protein